MPNLEKALTKLPGSWYFATFYLSHGYWQLPLDKASQALQSLFTPDDIYSPRRFLHGSTNVVTNIQATLADKLPIELRT